MSKQKYVQASALSSHLRAKLFGKDVSITTARHVHSLKEGCISYVTEITEDNIRCINGCPDTLILCPDVPEKSRLHASFILSDNPRSDFLYVIKHYFAPDEITGVDRTAVISERAVIGKNVSIGAYAWIGDSVRIGDNSIIRHHVIIDGNTTIGSNCAIKSGAVIGEQGFGFEHDEFGVPEHYPHIGNIVIGDCVWIGSGTTIERASLGETIIGNHVKIDDSVQIGNNAVVGDYSMVMAGSVICGQVSIGKHCWISPKCVVKEKLKINDGAVIGLGSVVISDVGKNTVVAGNPAKVLKTKGL